MHLFDEVKQLCKASLTHHPAFMLRSQKICEIGKMLLKMKAQRLVNNAGSMPLLRSYASDGTPLSTKTVVTKKVKDVPSVKRTAKGSSEYLVQTCYYRYYDMLGQHHTSVAIRDPLPLTNGKTAQALFAAGLEFQPTLRQSGHKGLIIEHCVFDRLAYGPLSRLHKQAHQADASTALLDESETMSKELLELLLWDVSTACAAHDCHNALKWSLFAFFHDTQLMKDLYLIIWGIRHSFDLVIQHMSKWCFARVAFVQKERLAPDTERYAFWQTLGVQADLLCILVEDLGLQWDMEEQALMVDASWQGRPEFWDTLSTTLLSLWEFTAFSDSRWCTVGTSCRQLLVALFTGFENYVAFMRHDVHASDYYLHLFARMSPQVKHFIILAGISAHVSESCLALLLDDNRVALNLDSFEVAMNEELAWISNIPRCVWGMLDKVAHCGSRVLCSDTLAAAHVQKAFVNNRFIETAKGLPWCLCRGDLNLNLRNLKDGPMPYEPTAFKIWTLMQEPICWPLDELVRGLKLMGDCPWTTTSTEQQHASATLIKRYHPDYVQDTVMHRAMVHSLRRLVPSRSEDEKQVEILRAKLQKLASKSPAKISGRQVFFKQMVALAQTWRQQGRALGNNWQHKIMTRHGVAWQNVSQERKAAYEREAHVARERKAHLLEDLIADVNNQLAIAESRAELAKTMVPPLCFSAAAMTLEDVQVAETLLEDKSFKGDALAEKRAAASKAPPCASPAMQQLWAEQELFDEAAHFQLEKPSWLPTVCNFRDHLVSTALVFVLGDQRHWYLFLYAMQSPQLACYAPMTLAGENCCPNCDLPESHRVERWKYVFHVDYGKIVTSRNFPAHDGFIMLLQFNLLRLPGQVAVTDAHPVPFTNWSDGLDPCREEKPPAENTTRGPLSLPSSSSAIPQDLLISWNFDLGEDTEENTAVKKRRHFDLEEDESQQDDELMVNLFEALEKMRESMCLEGGYPAEDFKVAILHGKSTKSLTGHYADAFQGQAKSEAAQNWCLKYGLNRSSRYGILHDWTPLDASTMALAWCQKMQHLYNIYVESGDPDYTYQEMDILGYLETEAFQALAGTTSNAVQLRRIAELRNLVPQC